MFKHLLVPTDGSELSLRAAQTAIELARISHARIHALHVVMPFHTVSYLAEALAATELSYTQESIAQAERYLAQVRDRAAAAGVSCDSSYVLDDCPYKAIVRTATEKSCDLIVMASHGWRGLNRLLLGSETHKVLLQSEIPVLVCR
ncbi:universal stress protein [Dyella sp.]|uniref:universal stress protein n=1 Tax=Dyella sp. TaxID=1869338 RepID=UPI002D7900D6|nr:universal stress protein [Dyella sp.]HET6433071.1 universal stress protein [Dyella sp.]